MREIDARGLACPAPVLHTKAALQEEKPGSISVIVDNAASQQNVQRFLESQVVPGSNKTEPTIGSSERWAQSPWIIPRSLQRRKPPPVKSWCCAPRTGWVSEMMNWA